MPKWQPGQSGNPSGRPRKGTALTDLLREGLRKTGPNRRRNTEVIVDKVMDLARDGQEWAIKLIWDRLEGRTAQHHEVAGRDGGPIEYRVTYDDSDGP